MKLIGNIVVYITRTALNCIHRAPYKIIIARRLTRHNKNILFFKLFIRSLRAHIAYYIYMHVVILHFVIVMTNELDFDLYKLLENLIHTYYKYCYSSSYYYYYKYVLYLVRSKIAQLKNFLLIFFFFTKFRIEILLFVHKTSLSEIVCYDIQIVFFV